MSEFVVSNNNAVKMMESEGYSDPLKYLGYIQTDSQLTKPFAKEYWSDFLNYINSYNKPIPLYTDFLEMLRQKDVKRAIVSSNSSQAIKTILGKYAKLFDPIIGIETAGSKRDKIEITINTLNASLEEIIYVTDTLGDVRELKDFLPEGSLLAVSWGYNSIEVLQQGIDRRYIISYTSEFEEFINIGTILEKEVQRITPH